MQATAKWKFARVSPQKARLVVDQIRGRKAEDALTVLRMSPKRAAGQIEKVLRSAIANAENTGDVDVDDLVVEKAVVDEGARLYRLRAAPQGRAHRYKHRLAHIVVTVGDGKPAEEEEEDEA